MTFRSTRTVKQVLQAQQGRTVMQELQAQKDCEAGAPGAAGLRNKSYRHSRTAKQELEGQEDFKAGAPDTGDVEVGATGAAGP